MQNQSFTLNKSSVLGARIVQIDDPRDGSIRIHQMGLWTERGFCHGSLLVINIFTHYSDISVHANWQNFPYLSELRDTTNEKRAMYIHIELNADTLHT